MRAAVIVVVAPCRNQMAGMAQVWEQVLVQAFIPQAAIEAFHEAVLHRLAWRDVMPFHTAIFLPFEHGVRRQLGAVARREEGLLRGYGRTRSLQIAQRVAITGSQVSTVVLHEPHC